MLLTCAAVHAQAVLPATTAITDAAADGTGRVWAITNTSRALVRWTGTAWKTTPAPAPDMTPAALASLPDGGVGVVWQGAQDSHVLTIVRGDTAQTRSTWTGLLVLPRVSGTRSGDVWITGAGGDVYRVAGKTATHVFNPPDADRTQTNPLLSDAMDMTEDAGGRVWLWTPQTPLGNDPAVPHFLLWQNGKLAPPAIKLLPPDTVNSVAPRDATHVWLAVRGQGIFEVNTSTMTAQFVPSPQSDAFKRVQKMALLGTQFGVVVSQNGDDNRSSVLWLWSPAGWTRAINGLDTSPAFHAVSRRPVLATQQGVWVGSYGAGLWLLPPSGTPKLLDWHVKFPLLSVDRLVPTTQSGLLALSLTADALPAVAIVPHAEAFATQQVPKTGVRTFATLFPLVQTANAHVWLLDAPRQRNAPPPVLKEWDGSGAWTPHALPDGANAGRLAGLRVGPDGRVWCVPARGGRGRGPAYAFSADTGQWTTAALADVPAAPPARAPRPSVPAGAPKPDTGSVAQDKEDTVWYTSAHVLYHVGADGNAVAAFAPDAPTPFADGRRVREALTDPAGGTFLRTQAGPRTEYVVVPKR